MNRHPNRIYQLIRRLDKVGPLTPEKIDRYNKELWAVLDLIMPSEIYQYRAGDEGHFMALEQEKVYLSDPVRFNDPTDGLCYVDFDDVLLETVLEQDYRSAMRRRGGRGPVKEPEGEPDKKPETEPDAADNSQAPDSELMKAIALGQNALEVTSKLREQVRIACFSETVDSDLMWSHYAGEQKGFAIRYRTDDLRFADCAACSNPFCHRPGFPLYPVLYRDRKSDITEYALFRAKCEALGLDATTELPIPLLPLIQKRKVWRYEREWRIVCSRKDLEYFDMKPDAIYLGPQIEEDMALRLCKIARKKQIPVFKMGINYASPSFELLQDDWSDWTKDSVRRYFEHQV